MTREVKRRIAERLDAVMASLGWPRLELFGMGSAYAKDRLVTPYFSPRVAGRPGRRYFVMEGYIGVIHQGFEQYWRERVDLEPEGQGLCVVCHLANFGFDDAKFIDPDCSLEEQVDAFGRAVAEVLEGMPGDESGLAAAFENDVLCRKRLYFFSERAPQEIRSVQGIRRGTRAGCDCVRQGDRCAGSPCTGRLQSRPRGFARPDGR